MKKIRALVILHNGFEEMEAVAPIDLLSRADIDVTLASISEDQLVSGRCGMQVQATVPFDEVRTQEPFDAVVLPGGPGIKALRQHPELCEYLKAHHAAGKLVACICAAPLILLDAGLLPNEYTAHPSTSEELSNPQDSDHVWSGNILTSQGAGTATQFALALVEALTDASTKDEVAASICWSK